MLRIAFAGTPEFALPTLSALAASPHQLVGVLTQPDRPAGRGREIRPGPIKQLALQLGLPLAQPASLRSIEDRSALAGWAADALVVVAYGLILPPAALALPRLGCFNVHASLLPRWRGAAPIQRAILAGDALTGVTIMQMDAGLDTGPVLLEARVPIGADTYAQPLHDRLAEAGAALLLTALAELEAGRLTPRPQSAQGVSYAAKIDRSEARIDWQRSAEDIARQVRALSMWPVAATFWRGEQLRIWEAEPVVDTASARAASQPGEVLGLEGERLMICCGQGVLGVTRLQLAGRRVIGAAEFARARPVVGAHWG